MNETLIEQIQTDASALDIKITAQEIAVYLSERKVPPEHCKQPLSAASRAAFSGQSGPY